MTKRTGRNTGSPLIILSLLSVLSFTACSNDPEDIRALTGGGSRQQDHATDVTLIYSKDGHVKMRAFAHDFLRDESSSPSYIDMNRSLKAEFFDSSGEVEHVLTADSCRFYDVKGQVLVWDSVRIVSRNGRKLKTDELVWNESVQQFYTEKPVEITTESEVLHGSSMEANSDFSWYKISQPKGTVEVKKGELPQ